MRRACLAVAVLAGCVSNAEPFHKAALTSDIEEARGVIAETLAGRLGVAEVTLGADDLAGTGVVSILPPRLTDFETASPLMPRHFWLSTAGGVCYLVEHQEGPMEDRHGGIFVALEGVTCRAIAP